MSKLPLLLTLVVGVALWAAPTPATAQVADFFVRYVADPTAPGENNAALPNGYELCPPNLPQCTKYSQAHHTIVGTAVDTPYTTDVLDVHNCNQVTVCGKTADTDGTNPTFQVQTCSTNACIGPTDILADVNGDGVVNATDDVAMTGDNGSDNDGDLTAENVMCMYGIAGHNKIRIDVVSTDDAAGAAANDDVWIEVSCR
jgi:hypothetical protein